MTKNTKIVLGIVLVLIVVFIGYKMTMKPDSKDTSMPASTEPIKIGFIGPLTGDAAAYGADTASAAQIALKEINTAGGVNGRQIELIVEDGKCNAKDGLSSAQKLINLDKVKIILSASCSGELLGFTNLAEQNKVLVLNTLASNPKISEAGDYIFRNDPSDADGGKQLAQLVVKSYKKVSIITENTEYAQGIATVFKEVYKNLSGTIVVDEVFSPDMKDFRSILLKIKGTDTEAIFLNPQAPANAARLAKQARELGLNQQFYVAYMSGPEFAASGPSAEGAYIIDVPGLATGKGAELLKKFKDVYNREPGYPYFVGSTYDALFLLTDAIKKEGENTTKIKDYLYALPEYDGTVGKYKFDKNGDLEGIDFIVRKVVDQKATELK